MGIATADGLAGEKMAVNAHVSARERAREREQVICKTEDSVDRLFESGIVGMSAIGNVAT
jgi:hypothetical protein